MTNKELRDLVRERVGVRWEEWSKAHPHLAAAVDRTRLIESAVRRLEEDERFQQAVASAEADRLRLDAASRVVQCVEGLISRVLRM